MILVGDTVNRGWATSPSTPYGVLGLVANGTTNRRPSSLYYYKLLDLLLLMLMYC